MTRGREGRARVDWDAATYDRVSDIQAAWGREVLDRLPLRGDETVLDAGCGTGRVTAALLERLPTGRVIAVDASPSMVGKARAALGERVEVFVADLSELELPAPVDAILSTAVFHWIHDHALLFRRLRAALKPGGRLVAQCGGEGNIASLRALLRTVCDEEPFAEFLADWDGPWNFRSAGATAASLEEAGFTDVDCRLEPRAVTPEEPRAFLESVTLGSHLARLPARLRVPFVDRVLAGMPEPLTLDYVRLNILARAPGRPGRAG